MSATDRYSRLVFWLKVTLPLVALAILSTLFFVAETLDPEAAIPYAKVDVERILTEQGVSGPTFGGVTANGVAISVNAAAVRPDDTGELLAATEMTAALDLPGGGHIDVQSPSGAVDSASQLIVLDGGVELESSTGISVSTKTLQASMIDGSIIAQSKVEALSPAGDLTAGSMELTRSKSGDTHLLVFKDGVRLVYQPKE